MAATDLLTPATAEIEDLDAPDGRRRLAEKVLSAFNYAYAIGEREIARCLHAVLAEVETGEGVRPPRRPDDGALRQAELWVAYVEARNSYHASRRGGGDTVKALAALEAMKDAYKRWSFS